MLLGDGKKSAKLTRDGVSVKEQGRPPEFYPWGAGEDDEARAVAEQAQALATAADEKAATAQATAEAAQAEAATVQATAEAAQAEAATARATAEAAAGAAANAVQKTVPEDNHRQTAGISLSAQNGAWSIGPNAPRTINYIELKQNTGEADEFVAVRIHTREESSTEPSNALLRLQYEDADESRTRYKVEVKASKGLGDIGKHTLTINGVAWRALSTLFLATLPGAGMLAMCVYTDEAKTPRYMIATVTRKGSTRTLGQILGTYGG